MITSCDKVKEHLTIHYKEAEPTKQEIFTVVLNKFGNEFDDFHYLIAEENGSKGTGIILVDIDFGKVEF